MAKTIIDDNSRETLAVTGSDNRITVTSIGRISVFNAPAITDNSSGSGNHYVINGIVIGVYSDHGTGTETAISLHDDNSTVTIGATGVVVSSTAVAMFGDDERLVNRGIVLGNFDSGAYVHGGSVENYGTLTGNVGLLFMGGTITNETNGKIYGTSSGISTFWYDFPNVESSAVTLVNHGLISASEAYRAYSGGDAADRIVNDGRMVGLVSLGGGNDRIDTRGGVVTGVISGNAGDDTLITDNAKYQLKELDGEGNDTVKSSVSYKIASGTFVENLYLIDNKDINATGNEIANHLMGNSGANKLSGGAGDDYLSGGKGNDILTGGDGNDDFQFRTGSGRDTITDLSYGETLDLRGWKGIENSTQFLNHAVDHGDDVWITLGKDTLVIADHHKADLQTLDIGYVF